MIEPDCDPDYDDGGGPDTVMPFACHTLLPNLSHRVILGLFILDTSVVFYSLDLNIFKNFHYLNESYKQPEARGTPGYILLGIIDCQPHNLV
jgi:hypothetical protein